MPKVSDEHRAARRNEILQAALRAFARGGYQRTSMADIIAESGLSAGAIYAYFDGKQDLLVAVAEYVLDQRRDDMLSLGATVTSPSEAITVFVEGIATLDVRPVLVQTWGEAAVDAQMRGVFQRVFSRLQQTLIEMLDTWFAAHPEFAVDTESGTAGAARVMASFGAGFVLQSVLLDDFDKAEFTSSLNAVMSIEPRRPAA